VTCGAATAGCGNDLDEECTGITGGCSSTFMPDCNTCQ
jgi:hypothetical protein